MTHIIVTNFFARASNSPKYVQPIGEQMRKAAYHAFESEEEFTRYLEGLEKWVKEINGKHHVSLSLNHTTFENYGEVVIYRQKSAGYGDLLRLTYIRLQGHVVVGIDGRTLRQLPFIKEEGE